MVKKWYIRFQGYVALEMKSTERGPVFPGSLLPLYVFLWLYDQVCDSSGARWMRGTPGDHRLIVPLLNALSGCYAVLMLHSPPHVL